MASENDTISNVIDRRRFVKLTGVSGAAALAGCSSGDDPDTETDDGESTGDGTSTDDEGDGGTEVHEDVTHVGVTTANPANLQFNAINSNNPPQVVHRLLFEPMAQWNYNDGEFKPAGIEEWNFTGDAFEMTVREGLTWSNGEDVTGEDVARQIRFLKADGAALSEWAGDVSVDGRTVTISVDGTINPSLVETDVLDREIRFDAETYEGMLESDGIEGLRGFADDDPVTNGIFSLENRDDQRLLATRNGEHPDADNVNFGQYAFDVYGGNNARQQALLSLDVDSDFSVAVPARLVANYPDAVEEVRFPDVWGIGLAPNHDHPYAGDRAVRQAMAYVINREICVQNSLPRAKRTPEIPTGVPIDAQEQYLAEVSDQFETYGPGAQDTESATAVLEEAGYAMEDGTWVDPDGDVVSLPVTVPGGWSDWVLAAETAVQHLSDFGFDSEIRTTGSYFDTIQSDDFVFITNTWLHGGPSTYPYQSLRHQLWEPQIHPVKHNYPPAMDADDVGGSEESLTIPARDGSGEREMDVGEEIQALATATDEETEVQLIRDLAYAANVDLPFIPLAEKRLQSWLTNDEWSLPDKPENNVPEARVSYAPTWLPRFADYLNYTGN